AAHHLPVAGLRNWALLDALLDVAQDWRGQAPHRFQAASHTECSAEHRWRGHWPDHQTGPSGIQLAPGGDDRLPGHWLDLSVGFVPDQDPTAGTPLPAAGAGAATTVLANGGQGWQLRPADQHVGHG